MANTPSKDIPPSMIDAKVMLHTAQAIRKAFQELGITYRRTNHPPVARVEEAQKYTAHIRGAHTKNLFLRNKKATRYYLVVVADHQRVDLKALRLLLAESTLSFASNQRLEQMLGLSPGGVSPLGLVCDPQKQVQVLLDAHLWKHQEINFHPETNRATLTLKCVELQTFLEHYSPHFRKLVVPTQTVKPPVPL